jgi:hypothetical protein
MNGFPLHCPSRDARRCWAYTLRTATTTTMMSFLLVDNDVLFLRVTHVRVRYKRERERERENSFLYFIPFVLQLIPTVQLYLTCTFEASNIFRE